MNNVIKMAGFFLSLISFSAFSRVTSQPDYYEYNPLEKEVYIHNNTGFMLSVDTLEFLDCDNNATGLDTLAPGGSLKYVYGSSCALAKIEVTVIGKKGCAARGAFKRHITFSLPADTDYFSANDNRLHLYVSYQPELHIKESAALTSFNSGKKIEGTIVSSRK